MKTAMQTRIEQSARKNDPNHAFKCTDSDECEVRWKKALDEEGITKQIPLILLPIHSGLLKRFVCSTEHVLNDECQRTSRTDHSEEELGTNPHNIPGTISCHTRTPAPCGERQQSEKSKSSLKTDPDLSSEGGSRR